MNNNDEHNKLEERIHYSEYNYGQNHPTLVLSGEFGSVGYDVSDTGELARCCICSAHYSNECVCGYFDSVDDGFNYE